MMNESTSSEAAPALSAVLVAVKSMATLHRTLRHLKAQPERDRIELVIVVPDEDAATPVDRAALGEFWGLRVVAVGPIRNMDRAVAAGVMQASGPFVALIEDHAFPAPDWAAHVIAAHDTPADAVGPSIVNGNPTRLASWTNYLIAYGSWSENAPRGPVDGVPGHNSSFRTELLRSFGDQLGDLLQRGGGLMEALRDRGALCWREPRARVAHLNPSTWRSTLRLRLEAGRAWGAARAAEGGWSGGKRLAFACAGPLIPAVRMVRELRNLRASGSHAGSTARTVAALAVGLVCDGVGQAVGYAIGPGRSSAYLENFEMGRVRHLARGDEPLLEAVGPRIFRGSGGAGEEARTGAGATTGE